jgi:bile acid:Na+ symporter, BASS family
VARQVFVAQLLPLGLGSVLRQFNAPIAEKLEPGLTKIGAVLLLVTVLLLLVNLWEVTIDAGAQVLAAILAITVAALVVGHLLGGPEPSMRTAVAITSAACNAGLALLVATRNEAPPAVTATTLAYLLVSVFTIWPYVAWRRAGARRTRLANRP